MRHPFYQEHLAFLREGGAAMARAFPRAADRLARSCFDPDVERLLEGIAFISSKVSERQQRSIGEVCQLLFDILFPHYLSPIPAMAVVEFQSEVPMTVPRGTELWSVSVMGTPCRFRTAMDTPVGDLAIEDLSWRVRGGGAQLTLHLQGERWLSRPPQPAAPGLVADDDRFTLHLHGEPLITYALFEWLNTRVDSVELIDAKGRATARIPVEIVPRGFAEDEGMLMYPGGSFDGFRVLQEYFALPERLLFLDIVGAWHPLKEAGVTDRFSLRFNLATDRGGTFVVTRPNVRLGCTPVINCFEHSADPIRRDLAKVEYRVRPAGPHLHYDIVRLLEVSGRTPKASTREYPLLSELDQASGEAFTQVRRDLFDGEVQTYIAVSDGYDELPPDDQVLLVDLLASNGQLPLALGVGDIARVWSLGDGSDPPPTLSGRNITAVSKPVSFPLGEELRLRLVTHLALTQREMTSLDALRDALDLYNFKLLTDRQVARAHQLIIDALLEAETVEKQRLYGGTSVWGQHTTVSLDEGTIGSGPEAYLLGCVLNEVIALATPLNLYSETTIKRTQRGDTLRWPARLGPHLLARAEREARVREAG